MASEVKTNKISPATASALSIGDSGDTITVPSGATLDISASTLTPPATLPASSGINLTALNASNLGSGTVPTARLGTGTANSSTFLTGAQTYAAAGGGFLGLVVYTADGTYTPGGTTNGTAGDEGSATVSKITVEVLSAGGGSGSCSAAGTSGGAGGAGSYALKVLDIGTDRAVITTCTATIGAAGAAASYISAQPGATGGVSSFAKATGSGTFTTVVTAGGVGGSNNTYSPGGGGAAPTTGDINIAGCRGYSVNHGGDSQYGWGGRPNPQPGTGYGTGSASGSGVYQNGIAGMDGIIVIWEYA
jgi:hypothetical protein